jgi:hypothetical protein
VHVRSARTVLYTQRSGPAFDGWLFAEDHAIVLQAEAGNGGTLAFARLADESLDQDLEPAVLYISVLSAERVAAGVSYRPLAKYWP